MVSVFNSDQVNVKLFPESPPIVGKVSRFLLYPVLVYRIRAPRFTTNNHNVFHRAVLGLLHISRRSASEISELLCLDQEFIQIILSELISRDLIDPSLMILTSKGKDYILESDKRVMDPKQLKSEVGYVIQDVNSFELYPYLFKNSDFSDEIEYRRHRLYAGTLGNRDEYYVHGYFKPSIYQLQQVQIPNLRQIASIVYKELSVTDTQNEEIRAYIELLDADPELQYLPVWVERKPDNKEIRELSIQGHNREREDVLSKWIMDYSEENEFLKRKLESLFQDLTEPEKLELDLIERMNIEVDSEMISFYPAKQLMDSKVYNAIHDFETFFKLSKTTGDIRFLKNAFVNLQIVFETLLSDIHYKYPDGYRVYLKDKQLLESFSIEEVKVRASNINSEIILPYRNGSQFRVSELKKAMQNPNKQSMKRMLDLALLASFKDVKHPLRGVLEKRNDFVVRLYDLANKRNDFSHKYKEITSEKEIVLKKDIQESKELIKELCSSTYII